MKDFILQNVRYVSLYEKIIVPCYLARKTCIWIRFQQGKRRRQTVSLQGLLLTNIRRNY